MDILWRRGERSCGRVGRRFIKSRSKRMAVSEIAANKHTVLATLQRVRTPVLAACCAGLLIGAGWKFWSVRRFQTSIVEAYSEMAAGRFGLAARNLDQLLAWKPDSDEAAYLLGMCEEARRRNKQAMQAWARVSPGSEFTHRAVLAQVRLLHNSGQLAAAEQLINNVAEDPRNDGKDLLVLLLPVYSQIGRTEEAGGSSRIGGSICTKRGKRPTKIPSSSFGYTSS